MAATSRRRPGRARHRIFRRQFRGREFAISDSDSTNEAIGIVTSAQYRHFLGNFSPTERPATDLGDGQARKGVDVDDESDLSKDVEPRTDKRSMAGLEAQRGPARWAVVLFRL
jgi:hypothetical protein